MSSQAISLRDRYFDFLYSKIAGREKLKKVARYLFDRWEFYWTVPNDDNRQADGYDLRYEFLAYLDDAGTHYTRVAMDHLLEEPVSVFEVIVALTNRIDFQLYDYMSEPRNSQWFLEVLSNLGISDFVDSNWDEYAEQSVDRVMQVLLDRTYDENGNGSLFPLENPTQDMTRVEIWYQMMAYLLENYPI